MAKPPDVDSYIDDAARSAQPMLRELRKLIVEAAPSATERISYGMPTYDHPGGHLLHFSAAKRHIGVYGLVHVDSTIPDQLAGFVDHRSTLHLPYDRPLPVAALVAAIRAKVDP